jgi:nucleotide-binding universal stress UspA family protein
MKLIVAPTDFSVISLNAVNYAADLSCTIGSNLSIIHVCPVPMTFREVPAPVYNLEKLITDAEEQMKLLKENVLLRTRQRVRVITEVRQGDVMSEIAAYCSSTNPYAVVLGIESAGAFERLLLGGKTISALKRLSWPLIVIPPEAKFAGLRKIGLACDFRKVIETIPIKELTSLVKEFNAELQVLHVSAESGDSYDSETIEESEWLRDILADLNPKYHLIKGVDIEKNINEFAEKNKLDLLIIIPKKHTLIQNLFQQSHSKELVLHTQVPLMAVHE